MQYRLVVLRPESSSWGLELSFSGLIWQDLPASGMGVSASGMTPLSALAWFVKIVGVLQPFFSLVELRNA